MPMVSTGQKATGEMGQGKDVCEKQNKNIVGNSVRQSETGNLLIFVLNKKKTS